MSAASGPAASRRARAAAWLRLARPHNAPLSLTAGLVGLAAGWDDPPAAAVALGVLACATGYAVGQTVNDFFDREADAVNAPSRPLVTGVLDPVRTLAATVAYTVALLAAMVAVAPGVAIWLLVASAGHALYTLTKGVPMVGNLVNGADVAVFVLIGAAAGAPDRAWHDVPSDVAVLAGIMALAFTAFGIASYFKDVPGDVAAGYRTIVVALGPRRGRWVVPPFAAAALGLACWLAATDPGALGADGAGVEFWALAALAAAAYGIGLAQLLGDPERNAYESLVWMTRATVLIGLALGAAVEPGWFLAAAALLLPLLELALRDTARVRQA